MKVIVRMIDIEVHAPELIPAIRSLGDKLPDTIELDAMPTVQDEQEQKLRVVRRMTMNEITCEHVTKHTERLFDGDMSTFNFKDLRPKYVIQTWCADCGVLLKTVHLIE